MRSAVTLCEQAYEHKDLIQHQYSVLHYLVPVSYQFIILRQIRNSNIITNINSIVYIEAVLVLSKLQLLSLSKLSQLAACLPVRYRIMAMVFASSDQYNSLPY